MTKQGTPKGKGTPPAKLTSAQWAQAQASQAAQDQALADALALAQAQAASAGPVLAPTTAPVPVIPARPSPGVTGFPRALLPRWTPLRTPRLESEVTGTKAMTSMEDRASLSKKEL